MAIKTISLEIDAYEKLRRAKRSDRESFSEVVRRARFDDRPSTGPALLAALGELVRAHPETLLTDDALDSIAARASKRTARARVPR
jgi:hypothetical protein